MTRIDRARLLTTPLLCILAACEVEPPLEESLIPGKADSALYVDTGAIWESHRVPVCWLDDTDEHAEERAWVREQVYRTWEFAGNIELSGWGTCGSSIWWLNAGISLSVNDEQPHAAGLGESMLSQAHATLNFTFQEWEPSCQSRREHCIRVIAAHEFGHLLGFAHEQNRPDTPYPCNTEEQGSDGDEEFGAWDRSSIMNYCNPLWNNGGELSSTDIQGTQHYYGVGPRYTAALFNVITAG